MKKPAVHVTDHAVIRYLERAMGYDVERLRRDIAATVDQAVRVGATTLTADGVSYRLSGKTVVTIVQKSTPNIRTGRRS